MKIKVLTVLLFLFAAIAGCKKETIPYETFGTLKNYPPESFVVNVLEISYNNASIEWKTPIDLNRDALFYNVYLNDSMIAMNLKIDTLLRIENLKPETVYQGRVEVTDKKSDAVVVPFSFKTKKYFLSFNKLYPDLNSGCCISLTPDGGYVIGTTIFDIEDDGNQALIIKMDSLGFVQWTTVCMDHLSEFTQIKPTSDNGFILVDNAKIIKLNQAGKEVWRFPKDETTLRGSSVVQTENNQYLVAGTSSDISKIKATITKFDTNGNLIWKKYYGNSKYTHARYIEKTNDGNYVVAGDEDEGIDGTGHGINLYVFEIDDDGKIVWEKIYDKPGYDNVYQIKNTNDNGFIVCGGNTGNREITSARILKIDHKGNAIWDKYYLWDNFKTYAQSIEQTTDGGYIFVGGTGYSPVSGLMVKLYPNGDLSWKKEFKPDYMDYVWYFFDLKITKDGGVIMTGGKGSVWGNGEKEVGMWLLKSDINGVFE